MAWWFGWWAKTELNVLNYPVHFSLVHLCTCVLFVYKPVYDHRGWSLPLVTFQSTSILIWINYIIRFRGSSDGDISYYLSHIGCFLLNISCRVEPNLVSIMLWPVIQAYSLSWLYFISLFFMGPFHQEVELHARPHLNQATWRIEFWSHITNTNNSRRRTLLTPQWWLQM